MPGQAEVGDLAQHGPAARRGPRPRLARRLESDATNELNLFLASVYRLGYHKLLIYPFRPSVHRTPRAQQPEVK
jgi:hypothetical protein